MITFIDHDKRTYSLVTFRDLQQQMADAAAKTKGAKTSSADGPQMNFDAHISSNGATRQLDGQTAKESLLTITMTANSSDNSQKAGMAATSEMWLIKDAPGLAEMRQFNERMAKELAVNLDSGGMTSLLAAQPGGAQALEELKKESAKMSGIPVLQVTRVGMTTDGQPLPAPSTAPLAPSQKASSTAGSVTEEVAAGTATQEAGSQMGRLGTFGRALSGSSMSALMHHAPSTGSPSGQAAGGSGVNAANAGVLLESQTELIRIFCRGCRHQWFPDTGRI